MDFENDEVLSINPNIQCHVCGEDKFEKREGFYYCQECGTKQEQVRLVEVEREEDFLQEKKGKKQKIKIVKAEKPQLTSWECYNYILRGFVEELLSFGAKEELKLMTLQVWAAYLRRMEVAFFNHKKPDLPKFGAKYLQNDAETIYNHSKTKKRRRRPSEDTSCTSGDVSRKSYRRNKRKLDESNYSFTSGTSVTSGGSCFTSSTSENSHRAIKIAFSGKARKYYKSRMPAKHIDKHAADAEGLLTCHTQPKARELNRNEYNLMMVNMKLVYSILAIALNLIEDEIQLSDLVRFINEGHISTSNVLQYFPENVAESGEEMLRKINFYRCPEKYADKSLRDTISLVCKNIGIHKPKKPNIIKLVRRYIIELCLPLKLGNYIERLINLLPPDFQGRVMGYYPGFEARAMAYIIFTLKLLYGLDGVKEYRISQCAKKLNTVIEDLNRRNCEKHPLLFVWEEWLEYIEMRKVIISHYNSAFCEQFKQCQNTSQLLEQMADEMRKTEDREVLQNDTILQEGYKMKINKFKALFERFQESLATEKEQKKPTIIDFRPSFTPALSYLKNIFLLYDKERGDNSSSHDLNIPDFMRIDHSKRDIQPYVHVKPLIEYFKKHQLDMSVHTIAVTKNKTYLGIFQVPRGIYYSKKCAEKACFDVTEEEWTEYFKNTAAPTDDLEFKSDLEVYKDRTCRFFRQREKLKKCYNPFMNYDLTMTLDDMDSDDGNANMPNRNSLKNNSKTNRKHIDDIQSTHSFELFSENNMEPIDNADFIKKPRRKLDNFNIFEGVSDDEALLKEDDGDESIYDDNVKSIMVNGHVLRDTTPSNLEEFIKLEPISPNHSQGTKNTSKMNDEGSTQNTSHKMYISNMDCWMMLGNIARLTNAQKSQLQDKFPRSFTWLLETCAQTINIDWTAVYDQLICIELMFCLSIKDLSTIQNCVYFNSPNQFRDIQTLIDLYRQIW